MSLMKRECAFISWINDLEFQIYWGSIFLLSNYLTYVMCILYYTQTTAEFSYTQFRFTLHDYPNLSINTTTYREGGGEL